MLFLRTRKSLDLDGLRPDFSLLHAKGEHVAPAQAAQTAERPPVHEDFGAVAGGDEAEAFAPVIPSDGSALATGERQYAAAARAVVRLRRILLLFPARPHKGDAAILAGQKAVGRKIEVEIEIRGGGHGMYCTASDDGAKKPVDLTGRSWSLR